MRPQVLASVILLFVFLASCGGDGSNSSSLDGSPEGLAVRPGPATADMELPAIPAGLNYQPARITSEYTVGLDGGDTHDNSGNVNLNGPNAEFRPADGELAWAIYEFSGSYADMLGSVSYTAENVAAGSEIWVAVSNYDQGRWQFFGPYESSTETIEVNGGQGEHASPAGHTYVAVLGWDGDEFDISGMEVYYPERYSVSGTVLTDDGQAIPGALVTSTITFAEAVTDAEGNFTIQGVPNGNWHVMASLYGWNFYDQPVAITVDGMDVSGLMLTGFEEHTNLEDNDTLEPNNCIGEASLVDLTEPLNATISAYSDRADYYRITLPAGQHYFKLVTNERILFPRMYLYTVDQRQWLRSPFTLGGTAFLGVYLMEQRDFFVGVNCDGSGGEYSLQLFTDVSPLGSLTVPVESSDSGAMYLTEVEVSNGSDTLRTITFSYDGIVHCPFLPQGTWDVTPIDKNHTFVPDTQQADINGVEVTLPPFVGTHALADTYEPENNGSSTAPTLALPYDSVLANEPLSIGGDDDRNDMFIVAPEAGRRLRILVENSQDPGINNNNGLIDVTLYDHDEGSWITGSFNNPSGQELRMMDDTDGGEYRVELYAQDKRAAYTLRIEEYMPVEVQFGVEQDGVAIPGAQFRLHSEDLNWTRDWQAYDSSGVTSDDWPFLPGEVIHVKCIRYGMSCDGETRIITADADKTVIFNADADSIDSLEPSSYYNPFPVSFPVDISSTASTAGDDEDSYLFTPSSPQALLVEFETDNEDAHTWIDLVRVSDDEYFGGRELVGSGQLYLLHGGEEPHKIGVYPDSLSFGEETCNTHYTLRVSHAEAFTISGTVLSEGSPHGGPIVYCLETGDVENVDWDTGEWDLGAFPPGDYTIACFAANHTVADNNRVVTVSDSNVVVDFLLEYSYEDAGEPNDSEGTATPLAPSGASFTCTMDSSDPINGDDYLDHFIISPETSGWLTITVEAEPFLDEVMNVYVRRDGRYLQDFLRQPDGKTMKFHYYEPAGGIDYIIRLNQGDLKYTITAEYPELP